ncbi:MAG: amylo-alpha-1,6-glucosidase [Bacteroidota bacterium]
MFKLEFEKNQLINLEYSLEREFVRANRAGSFASTTIIGCNTRKYHGLLICPQPAIDNDNHVLLSTLDETIIQKEAEFNFGIHKYPGTFSPKGHKYIDSVEISPIPKTIYRVGGVVFSKEIAFVHDEDRILVRYTLIEAHSPTILRLKPFLAFRNIHKLSKVNDFAEKKYSIIKNGIKTRMYVGYSYLNMQFSKPVEYVHVPDWYYNVEYIREIRRGYEGHEDLFVPGYFEMPIEKGESIYFSAGIDEVSPSEIAHLFKSEIRVRIPRDSFENCLRNSAQQFISKRGNKVEVIAGFPWFGRWGRDTFIAAPGLTVPLKNLRLLKDIIDTMIEDMNGPLFPNIGSENNAAYNSVDAPLWFFWTLQQYAYNANKQSSIWAEYSDKMKQVLYGYKNGTSYNIKMLDNCMIYAGGHGVALTWMDAVVAGKPVTPRTGMQVEINALWYNAIKFSIEVSELAGDMDFVNEWQPIASMIDYTFKETFWSKEKGYLADFVDGDYSDWSVRPNQVFATSLPYTPLSESIRKLILDKVQNELLTPRGLRTLSPKSPNYKPIYFGNQTERDLAYHQGTVWPWLFGHFAEAYLKIHGKSGIAFIQRIVDGFEGQMMEHGICTISEVCDGDPPHNPGGTISQAWSVSEILRVMDMLKVYSK